MFLFFHKICVELILNLHEKDCMGATTCTNKYKASNDIKQRFAEKKRKLNQESYLSRFTTVAPRDHPRDTNIHHFIVSENGTILQHI